MKKRLILLAGLAFLLTGAKATVVTVLVSDFTFTPKNATAHVGDTIRWVWSNGDHTTTSGGIPAGAAAWNSAISSTSTVFDYKLTVAGTYNYVCTPHASLGMTGTINSLPLGVSTQARLNVRIAPNPAQERIEISMPELRQDAVLNLTDAAGRTVFEATAVPGRPLIIQTGEYASGLYQLRIQQGEFNQVERVVIQH